MADFIILLMGILYLFEINIIYNIIYFVIIVISYSYILYINNIYYISYILIIVYSTALIILFGFIVMKSKNYSSYSSIWSKISSNSFTNNWWRNSYYLLPIFLYVIYFLYKDPFIFYFNIDYNIKSIDMISIIGNLLYKDPIYIPQLFISAIILLFPIIAIIYL